MAKLHLQIMLGRHTKIYLSVVRPVLEYVCRVWHTDLTWYLVGSIECVQKGLLNVSTQVKVTKSYQTYNKSQHSKNVVTCVSSIFVKMCTEGHKLNHLLPPIRDSKYDKYPVPRAQANR